MVPQGGREAFQMFVRRQGESWRDPARRSPQSRSQCAGWSEGVQQPPLIPFPGDIPCWSSPDAAGQWISDEKGSQPGIRALIWKTGNQSLFSSIDQARGAWSRLSRLHSFVPGQDSLSWQILSTYSIYLCGFFEKHWFKKEEVRKKNIAKILFNYC